MDFSELDIKCIIGIVERGKADKVVEAAKKAGAKGATIFYGRGTGETEVNKFLKLNIESSKEIIIILCEEEIKEEIMNAMVTVGRLKDPGTGIVFSLQVTDLIGLRHRKDFEE